MPSDPSRATLRSHDELIDHSEKMALACEKLPVEIRRKTAEFLSHNPPSGVLNTATGTSVRQRRTADGNGIGTTADTGFEGRTSTGKSSLRSGRGRAALSSPGASESAAARADLSGPVHRNRDNELAPRLLTERRRRACHIAELSIKGSMNPMEMALGRRRVLVVHVQSHPARAVYDGSVVERAYQRRELQRELLCEQVERQRLPYGALSWHSGL